MNRPPVDYESRQFLANHSPRLVPVGMVWDVVKVSGLQLQGRACTL